MGISYLKAGKDGESIRSGWGFFSFGLLLVILALGGLYNGIAEALITHYQVQSEQEFIIRIMLIILFALAGIIAYQLVIGNEILLELFSLRERSRKKLFHSSVANSEHISSRKNPLQREKLNKLIEQINSYFNLQELESLCRDLNVDIENLGGSIKIEKIVQLVESYDRQRKISDLVEALRNHKPKVNWINIK